MKRLALALFILHSSLCILHAYADDYKYLTIVNNSMEKSIVLETVQKITFKDGQMVIATSNGNETFAQVELEKMFFSIEPATRVEAVPNQEKTSEQMVYDLSGREMNAIQLKRGIYIVNGKKLVIK